MYVRKKSEAKKKRSGKSIYTRREPNLPRFHSPNSHRAFPITSHFISRAVLGEGPRRCCEGLARGVKAETLTCTLHSVVVLRAGHEADVLAALAVAKRREPIAAFCAGVFGMCGLAEWSGGQECTGHPGQTRARLNGHLSEQMGRGNSLSCL